MPLDGEYTPLNDSTLMGTMVSALPNSDIDLALTEITGALQGYEDAEEFDSINMWEQNMLSREGRTLRQADIEFDPNLCSPVIDAVNDRLIITSITATSGSDTDTAASDAATAEVNAVTKANQLATRYRDWNRKALRDGDGYIIVWPTTPRPADARPELTNDEDVYDSPQVTAVNITYGDPRNCRMFYDPENPRIKLFFAQMWEVTLAGEKKPRIRMNLFYPDRIEKWISGPGNRQKTAKEFKHFLDPDEDGDNDYPGSDDNPDGDPAPAATWPMPNPYGEVPCFHLRTAYEYGKPEHRNAFALQGGASKLIEMLMVVVEFNGFPQRYALQEADSLGTQSIREDPLADHSPADWDHDFTESALSTTSAVSGAISNETGSNYESNPGAMQIFKGFKEVSQFQAANPAALLEPLKQFALLISTATGTPLWKFQGLGGQTPSGEALRIAEMPLVQKVTDRQAMFGGTWEEVYEFALKILGVAAQVKISWSNPATNDLKEVWDLVKLMIELGVPRDVAFMRAGVSESEAQEWAKTYDDVFALAAYQQSRALQFRAQADLLQQQAMAAKIANGIPQRQAFLEAGYSETDVDGWLSDREEELGLARRITLLQQLGSAIQSIGMGVNLGVLTAPGANDIVATVLGELVPSVPIENLDLPDDDTIPDDQSLTEGALPPVALPSAMAPLGQFVSNEPQLPPGQASWVDQTTLSADDTDEAGQ